MPCRQRLLLLLSCCLLFLLKLGSCAVKGVVELTDGNFDIETRASEKDSTVNWFILFKAERCPHCRKMAPDFELLTQNEKLNHVRFATVDVPTNRATTIRFGIRGFPSLVYLHKGKLHRYKSKRKHSEMLQFLLDPPSEGEEIPPPPTTISQIIGILSAVWLELWDALTGKSGVAGVAIVIMLVVGVGLVGAIVAMFFMPEVDLENKRK